MEKFMGSRYLDRLASIERQELIEKLHNIQNRKCYICNEDIDLVLHGNNIDIDHIQPLKMGGRDSEDNLALTHDHCNRSKQASHLKVARIMADFEKMIKQIKQENRSPNLGDVLEKFNGARFDLKLNIINNKVSFSFPEIDDTQIYEVPLYTDNHSKFKYFFAMLPIEYLHHDMRINPRAIGSNLRKLVEEFFQGMPQLQISLAWTEVADNHAAKIQVFDGQHKAAAQILLGERFLPLRVFVNPDEDTLLTANTNAGTTLRQVAFDKLTQRSLGSSLLQERITKYRNDKNLSETSEDFSEQDLAQHFKGESREIKRYILDWVRSNIINKPENKLRDYIEVAGRSADLPISYSTVEKTFYSFFIYPELLTTPFDYQVEEGTNPRDLEIKQILRLMNIIAEEIYIGKFDTARSCKRIEHNLIRGEDIPDDHIVAYRLGKEEIIYSWLKLVQQVIYNYFITTGEVVNEQKQMFQIVIPDMAWDNVRLFIRRFIALPMWKNRDFASTIFSGKHNADFWHQIFKTGKTPDGQQIMTSPINIMEMIARDSNN